jgi:hypothetical protein
VNQVRIFRIVLISFTLFLGCVGASEHDIQIYTRGYDYLVLSSPEEPVQFIPSRDSQILLSPHLLVETNISSEEIPVSYELNEKHYSSILMMSQSVASPYIALELIQRQMLDLGESVTMAIQTNVPSGALSNVRAFVNGKQTEILNNEFTFDAYSKYSNLVVAATLLSQRQLRADKLIEHDIDTQFGCDVVFDSPSLYAICFSNHGTVEDPQFYLNEQAIGSHGQAHFGETVPDDVTLHVTINGAHYRFDIQHAKQRWVAILHD